MKMGMFHLATHFFTALFFLLLAFHASSEPEPGFDCEKASNFVEVAICEDTFLASLDVYLNVLYRQYSNLSFSPESLKAQQITWLKERNACQTRECVKTKYLDRVQDIIQGAQNIDENFTALDPAVVVEKFQGHMEKMAASGAIIPRRENPFLPPLPVEPRSAQIESFERKGTEKYVFQYRYNLKHETSSAGSFNGSFVVNSSGELLSVDTVEKTEMQTLGVPGSSRTSSPTRSPVLRPTSSMRRMEVEMPSRPSRPGSGAPSFSGTANNSGRDTNASEKAAFKNDSADLGVTHDVLKDAADEGFGDAERALTFFAVKPHKSISGAGVLPCDRHDGLLYLLKGSDGYDRIECSWGHEVIDVSDGNDHIDGGWGNEIIVAGEGTDTILGSWGDEVIYPGPGNDEIDGSWGNLILIYGKDWGTDTVEGECSLIIFSKENKPEDLVWKDNKTLFNQTNGGSIQLDSACSETFYSSRSF
ncbi:hypothetical protein [Marinimicrobium agarilyticum]|uniref:hypothetical protein n=1 Tax=Marinimicrobium agarilyticum TaxID=306546 RepID=UPI0003FA215E|nr:hypothetical protein [Marinimicrobium agarilyticum]